MTKQKRTILNIIENSCEHLNAKQVYMLAKFQIPNIAFGTVYNNLNTLVEESKISRVQVVGMPDRFERNFILHNHICCDKCGKLTDIDLGDINGEFVKRTGYDIIRYDLMLHYLCDDCKTN